MGVAYQYILYVSVAYFCDIVLPPSFWHHTRGLGCLKLDPILNNQEWRLFGSIKNKLHSFILVSVKGKHFHVKKSLCARKIATFVIKDIAFSQLPAFLSYGYEKIYYVYKLISITHAIKKCSKKVETSKNKPNS